MGYTGVYGENLDYLLSPGRFPYPIRSKRLILPDRSYYLRR